MREPTSAGISKERDGLVIGEIEYQLWMHIH